MKKKVLFIIYSSKKVSGGGHFYSLKSISSGLEDLIDFRILNLGKVFARPLVNNPKAKFIPLTPINFPFKIFTLRKLSKPFEVIHAFDFKSLFIARTISLFKKTKIIYTKCGGVNGSRYIPDADTQILFSKENYNHFQEFGNPKTPRYLLPNRVNKVNIDIEHEKKFCENFNLKDHFILLRISRFNSYYDTTFQQSIELLKEIQKRTENAILIFIGKIQSKEYFESFKQKTKGLPVILVTEEVYTDEASRLLNIADIVISTGRGVMEACSLNKPVFCPVRDSKIPINLNSETFKKLFENNFSERVILDADYIDKQNENFLHKNIKPNTIEFFKTNFSVESVKEDYKKIYSQESRITFHLINYIGHALRFIKSII